MTTKAIKISSKKIKAIRISVSNKVLSNEEKGTWTEFTTNDDGDLILVKGSVE